MTGISRAPKFPSAIRKFYIKIHSNFYRKYAECIFAVKITVNFNVEFTDGGR